MPLTGEVIPHPYLPDAVRRTQAEWDQGDRGAQGYEDAGGRGLYFYPSQPQPARARVADGTLPVGSDRG